MLVEYYESDQNRLRKELQFRKALVAFTNELLSTSLSSSFYQTALERTVELVPDAEAGSVLIRHEDGLYHFEAAVEFDFEVLRSITLSDEEMGKRSNQTDIQKIEIHDYEDRLGREKASLFRDAGKLEEIRATLSVPLRMGSENMGYFNLDNFSSSEAFNEDDVEIAEGIAGQVSLALYRLLLEKRLQEEREHFQHMAHHDALTGLANRRLFIESLERALAGASRRGSGIGLLFVDMDNFKQVNDTHGHDAGDRVLTETARRIEGSVRKGDLAARLGGDEFGVLLIDVKGPADTRRACANVVEAVSEPLNVDGRPVEIQASVGTATYPQQASEGKELFRLADRNMYQIKMTE